MEAIDVLMEQWQKNKLSTSEVAGKFSSCSLYVTCEPCIMCASALSILGMPLQLFCIWSKTVILCIPITLVKSLDTI